MVTLPNLLTMLRIAVIPVFVREVLEQRFGWALITFLIAGISDGLDGLLARKLGQKSEFGEKLDPIADKLLLVTAFVILTLPGKGYQPIPLWVTATMVLRDLVILSGALAIMAFTTIKRFPPSMLGKISTVAQIVTVLIFMLAQLGDSLAGYLVLSYYLTFIMAVLSGAHYVLRGLQMVGAQRREQR